MWLPASFNGRILIASLMVAAISTIVRLGSLGKEILVARYFGASSQLDAFYIAFLLPAYVSNIAAAFANDAFIPIYFDVRARDGDKSANALFANIAAFGLFALAALILILGVLQRWYLPILATGFAPNTLKLARLLSFLLIASLAISGVNTLWRALLNAHERFALTSSSQAAIPLVIAFMLVLCAKLWSIYALALGWLLGCGMELVVNGFGLRRLGKPLLPHWHGLDPSSRQILRQATPAVAGAVLIGTSTIIDQSMAASLSSGSVSVLNYANKLVPVLLAIATTSLWTVMLPALSRLSANHDWQGVRSVLTSYTRLIIAASIPAVIIIVFASNYLILMIFHRGSFTLSDVHLTARIQSILSLQLPFYSLAILYVSGLCALKQNYVLMWGAVISVIENLSLNFIFMRLLGLPGIALSTSVVYATSCFYLRFMLYRTIESLENRGSVDLNETIGDSNLLISMRPLHDE